MPFPRPRFSLLSLFVLMTIVGLGLGLLASSRRNAQLHAANEVLVSENLRHRNELGIFDLTDPKLIHAIRAPTEDNASRKYRVYLPPRRKYNLCYKVNGISEEELPDQIESRELPPGRHYLISLKITRAVDRKTGNPLPYGNVYLDVVTTDESSRHSASFGIGIAEKQNDWLLNKATGHMAFSWQEIGRELTTYEPEEAVVLYRARANTHVIRSRRDDGKPSSWSSQPIVGKCDGFMAWIEPVP